MKILQLLRRQLAHCVVLLAALAASSFAGAATITMTSSTASVMPGQTVTVRFAIAGLTAAPLSSLSGFDLDIFYDSSRLQFTGFSFVDPASGINQLDLAEAGSFGFFGGATAAGGVIDVYGLSGNSASFLDAVQAQQFQFLSLDFSALAGSGATAVATNTADANLLILDSGSGDLPVNFANASVTVAVGATAEVPEPQSFLLLLAGALALAMARSPRWRARSKAAAALLALSLAASAPAAAQARAPAPAAAPVAVSAVIAEVQGKRVLLRLSSGEMRWVSAERDFSKADIGRKLSARLVARGDTFLISDITVSD